jgi:hypothetical protein
LCISPSCSSFHRSIHTASPTSRHFTDQICLLVELGVLAVPGNSFGLGSLCSAAFASTVVLTGNWEGIGNLGRALRHEKQLFGPSINGVSIEIFKFRCFGNSSNMRLKQRIALEMERLLTAEFIHRLHKLGFRNS